MSNKKYYYKSIYRNNLLISLLILSSLYFSFVQTQSCENIDIKINSKCIRENINKDNLTACCVLSPINQTINIPSFCKSYSQSTSYPTSDAIDGIQYNVVCHDIPSTNPNTSSFNKPKKRQNEVKSFTQNAKCGKDTVTYESDCTNSSTLENSCCFYSYSDFKGCFWLGSKFDGKSNYNGIKFNCRVENIIANFSLMIMIFLLIIM